MTAKLRPPRIEDLPCLCKLEQESFPSDRLSRRQMRYHIKNPNAFFVISTDEANRPSGYALMFFRKNGPARLYSIAVRTDCRSMGIGKILLDEILREAQKRNRSGIVLEVRAADQNVRSFYERAGFRQKGVLPAYYEDGADGIKMAYTLQPGDT